MILYNVTINIDNSVHDIWLNWMQEKHIPEVLSTGKFSSARLIKVLTHGLSGPIRVNGEEFKQLAPLPMPPMGLNDQQVADVLSYVRANFSNKAPAVTPEQVKTVRAATADRTALWTESELAK